VSNTSINETRRFRFVRRLWVKVRYFVCERPREIACIDRLPGWDRRVAVLLACAAVHQGEWELADSAIVAGGQMARLDAACLNILGVIAEKRREWNHARRMYGRAIAADRYYLPAQQNMRRLYELHTFGHSTEPVALDDGDTMPGLIVPAYGGVQ